MISDHPEIAIVLVIALSHLRAETPARAGPLDGPGIREFKDSVTGGDEDQDERTERAELEAQAAEPRPSRGAEPVEGEVVAEKRGLAPLAG